MRGWRRGCGTGVSHNKCSKHIHIFTSKQAKICTILVTHTLSFSLFRSLSLSFSLSFTLFKWYVEVLIPSFEEYLYNLILIGHKLGDGDTDRQRLQQGTRKRIWIINKCSGRRRQIKGNIHLQRISKLLEWQTLEYVQIVCMKSKKLVTLNSSKANTFLYNVGLEKECCLISWGSDSGFPGNQEEANDWQITHFDFEHNHKLSQSKQLVFSSDIRYKK